MSGFQLSDLPPDVLMVHDLFQMVFPPVWRIIRGIELGKSQGWSIVKMQEQGLDPGNYLKYLLRPANLWRSSGLLAAGT